MEVLYFDRIFDELCFLIEISELRAFRTFDN